MKNQLSKIDSLVRNHLEKLSLREKIGQCIMIEPVFCLEDLNSKGYQFESITDPGFLDILFKEYHIGLFLFGGITRLGDSKLIDWATHLKKINEYAKEVGHIPLLYGVDAVHGVNFVKETTIYPHNLSVVSSYNNDLAKRYSKNVSAELSSIGFNLNFAPTIDVARDPRWGRVYESLGEDSFLASSIAESLVAGIEESSKVAGCAKHFVGYGESRNGMDRTPADLSERALKEHHLPPFKKVIESGVKTIMVNGGDFNGVPVPASKNLLTKVLREELGFKGVTLSDWEDVSRLVDRHFVVKNKEEAILRAFNAGLDMNMAVSALDTVDIMEQLVLEGKISEERLNEAVTRILRTKYELGLFDGDGIKLDEIPLRKHLKESKEIAYEMATESFVLLKNNDDVLPIRKDMKKVLLVGKTAHSKRHLCGGWTLNWASAFEEDLAFDTIYEVLKRELSNTEVTWVGNLDELNNINVSDFDLCINVVGEEPHSEWLGDSFDLLMEKEEEELLKACIEQDIKVVMVGLIGRPCKLDYLIDGVDGLLWGYLPGSEGARALVDCLLGNVVPSGKLPITFPKDANQTPCVYNARRYSSGEIETSYDPLFAFGYGLSYTNFSYSNLVVKHVEKGLDVFVDVKNAGKYEAKEVVQLFIKDVYASVTRPLKSLKGFKKVLLKPNQTKTVLIHLGEEELSLFDEFYDFVLEKREIDILISDLISRVEIG